MSGFNAPSPAPRHRTTTDRSDESVPVAAEKTGPAAADGAGSDPSRTRRTDLVAGLIGAGVYLFLIALTIVGAPLLPTAADGAVGVYERVSVITESGYEVSFVAPQGWYPTGETNVDASGDEQPDPRQTPPNVASFASPDGLAELVVTGYDAEPDPDNVLFLHTCRVAGNGDACVDVQLITNASIDDSPLAGATAATRALADSVGVVS